jgi:hypothetical protein
MPALFGIGFYEILIIGCVLAIMVVGSVGIVVAVLASHRRASPSAAGNPKLFSCPDCGNMVSYSAAACPHCGAPNETPPKAR